VTETAAFPSLQKKDSLSEIKSLIDSEKLLLHRLEACKPVIEEG
jgi:hypothetical protein